MVRRQSTTQWVVVGYGMGSYHARLISEVTGIELHGVCDVDPAKLDRALAEHPGVQAYASYADVLKDPRVDGVAIVTPHNVHAKMAIQAMDAGKHAITDKAMCLTVTEAKAMIAARDRNGVLLTTFHNRRWDADFLTVRQVIDEDLIGRPYHIQSCVTGWGKPGGWRAIREQMGGWMYDWGAHTLDQILLLAQARPVRVYAFAHHRRDEPGSVEDYINCTITFESGLTATTIVGYLNRIEMDRWYVFGDKGALVCRGFDGETRVKTALGAIVGEITVPPVKGDWKEFYQNVADTLAGRSELAVRPEQLVPQIAIAEAAYRSIESGQTAVPEY